MSHLLRLIRSKIAGSITARLCLILSLWQAPVPWLHCHETTVDSTANSQTADKLRLHLAVYHSTTIHDQVEDLGWHCHWVLPGWTRYLDNDPEDDLPVDESVAFDPATISTIQQVGFERPYVGLLLIDDLRQHAKLDRPSRQQFDCVSNLIPPPAGSCVLRC